MTLRDKSYLITGGTSGIGRAAALLLASRGANVTVTGRREPEGVAVAAEIARHGVKSRFVRGDVTSEADVERMVGEAAALTGRLDGAFNNAGVELANVPTEAATPEQYRAVFDINVLGILLCMKHELRALGAGGSIVNNASVAGSIGMPGVGIYVASKHAVLGLTKSAALEAAAKGVRVNAVSPGAIITDMFTRFTGAPPRPARSWNRYTRSAVSGSPRKSPLPSHFCFPTKARS